jgi:hypothetical protein
MGRLERWLPAGPAPPRNSNRRQTPDQRERIIALAVQSDDNETRHPPRPRSIWGL